LLYRIAELFEHSAYQAYQVEPKPSVPKSSLRLASPGGREMRVPRSCLDLRVSKQFSDHRQTCHDQEAAGCKRMAEIVNAHIIQSRGLANAAPWMLEVGEMCLLLLSHDNVRIVFHARQRFQQRYGSIAEMDGLRTSLAIGYVR